jgi:hypothetical protein
VRRRSQGFPLRDPANDPNIQVRLPCGPEGPALPERGYTYLAQWDRHRPGQGFEACDRRGRPGKVSAGRDSRREGHVRAVGIGNKMDRPEQQSFLDPPCIASGVMSHAQTARSGTFTDNMRLPVHRWFRYSAGFSAEWAEQIIHDFSPSIVLDPFAGSGTTLLAAESAGALAIGFESHPFVARIAAAKTHWNQDRRDLSAAAEAVLHDATRRPSIELATVPALMTKCYTPEALQQLYALRDAYLACASQYKLEIGELLWLALTAILRTCSFVGTAQWQYVLPNKRKAKQVAPVKAFGQKIADMLIDMDLMERMGARSDARILLHDARQYSDEVPPASVDLVVTSPPYPNNYDYADATRLEMTFWGEVRGWGDLQDVVRKYIIRSCSQHATAEKLDLQILLSDPAVESIRNELTAVCDELAEVRQTKGGKKAYHTMIAAYFGDLSKVFQILRRACTQQSTLCFVIGDSAPYGVYVPAEQWLGRLAVAAGFESFKFEKLRDRNIKWKNRKHRVPLHEGRLWIKG